MKVKFTKNDAGYGLYKKGDTGVLLGIDDGSGWVAIDSTGEVVPIRMMYPVAFKVM